MREEGRTEATDCLLPGSSPRRPPASRRAARASRASFTSLKVPPAVMCVCVCVFTTVGTNLPSLLSQGVSRGDMGVGKNEEEAQLGRQVEVEQKEEEDEGKGVDGGTGRAGGETG